MQDAVEALALSGYGEQRLALAAARRGTASVILKRWATFSPNSQIQLRDLRHALAVVVEHGAHERGICLYGSS